MTSFGRRASVLIVVLWVCLGLVSLALLFGHSALMALRGSDNDLAGRDAQQAVEGAARYAETLFLNPQTPGLMPDVTSYQSDAMTIGDATFWFIGQPASTTTASSQLTYGLVDEASKLNLNLATPAMLQLLSPNMTAEFAAAIKDWRDPDQDITQGGAESETYARKKPAYRSKDLQFDSVDELALVNGATLSILYGEDANQNGVLDPNEDDGDKSLPADNSDGKLDAGILSYVTAFTSEPNVMSDGTSLRMDVRTVRPQVTGTLNAVFGDARGQQIGQELQRQLANTPNNQFGSVLEFYKKSGMTAEEFDQIYDSISTSGTAPAVAGLVNVNTASETVLAAIPGLADQAANIVATRTGRAADSTSIAWVGDLIGPEAGTLAGPFLTGRSYQFSADIAAVGAHGRGFRRTRFVIDTSDLVTHTPKIIYRRNLARLGWPLGSEVREKFAMQKGATP